MTPLKMSEKELHTLDFKLLKMFFTQAVKFCKNHYRLAFKSHLNYKV